MTRTGMKSSAAWLISSMLLAGSLWAQDAPVSSAGVAASSPPASTTAHNDSYIIGNDDVLSINVWKEPDVSRTLPVRSDGKISLPLAGELQASGQTPHQLEMAIAAKLKNFIDEPEVTVIVTEIKSQNFNILGEVNKPGTYALSGAGTVLDAIALAGGFRDFAKRKSIYVLRRDANGSEQRLPFNYKDVIKGEHAEQNIKLQAHDTIVVP